MPVTLEEAAVAYATSGWPIFPLAPGTKNPLRGSHGFYDATTDINRIREWWDLDPECNIGFPTGEKTGVTILDVDIREGKHGDQTLAALEAIHGPLPLTRRFQSWSGGVQHWFRYSPSVPSRSEAFGHALDAKNTGGYVVLPPSRIRKDGRIGAYRWLTSPTMELAEFPVWLVPTDGCPRGHESKPGAALVGEPTLYPLPDAIPHGHRRKTLFRLGRRWHLKGESREAIAQNLRQVNERCLDLKGYPEPLPERELRAVIKSVFTTPSRDGYPAPGVDS